MIEFQRIPQEFKRGGARQTVREQLQAIRQVYARVYTRGVRSESSRVISKEFENKSYTILRILIPKEFLRISKDFL